MRERLNHYLRPPVFPGDEEKTFTAGLLHVILWSLLVGICLYTLIASLTATVQSHMLLIAWLYVLALGGLTLVLMVIMRRGYVQAAAISINIGLWIIMTIAAYTNGGVIAPAYSGYLIIIVCTSLLVNWQWGLVVAVVSALAGAVFLLDANNLPDWRLTWSPNAVWSATVAYFFVTTLLLALVLRAIKRAGEQTRHEMIERLKIEQALSYSELRFRAIFDSVNDAIFVQDLDDGRILDVNQTMCEMYGYTAEEARRMSVGELSAGAAPYTQQEALAWIRKAARGEPQVFEWQAKTREGRVFWVEVNMRRAVINGQDRLLVVVRNIDDRKRTEAALRREQAYYQAIVNATPVMLWLKDTENRMLHVNPAAATLEGVEAGQVEGRSAYDLYPHEQAEASYRDDVEVIKSGQPKLGLVEQHTAAGTGKVMWIETGKVPVRDEQGTIVGVLDFAVDITARQEAEERERRISQGLRVVIEAAQELIECADLDTLYRRSVELAREKLGLERCSLYLMDDREEFIVGTFGTDDQGRTTDEHLGRLPVEDQPGVFTLADQLWVVFESVFSYWNQSYVEWLDSKGWAVATPIRSHQRTIGVMYNDTAITRAPLDDTQQDVAAVYCSLLGSLLELKRTEAELAHERDLLQSLMDNFPDTIYFKDTASRFTRINLAQARMLGVADPGVAIGKTDADFFQRNGLSQLFLAEEQRLMTNGEPIIDRVEYNPLPDGQPRWLSASKVPLRNAAGQIVGMVGISRDVTDRILAQRRDQTISEGLRAVVEGADELMSCADLDTLCRHAIELAREKLKVERCGLFTFDEQGWLRGTYGTDLHGKTSDERSAHVQPINLEGLDATSDRVWKIIEIEQGYWEGDQHRVIGEGWVGVTFIGTRDRVMGVLYNDTAITHAPVDEAQQEVLAVYGSLLGSLIELKRAEEALRDSEGLYRQAIEAAGAVPYYMDYATESYRFMGDGVQQLTGLTPAEMRPSRWDALMQAVYPLGQAADFSWREAVREAREGHIMVWRADYYVRTADGRYCWVNDASVQVLDEQGRPRGAIGILQDITDRKRVELALRESESTMRALVDAIPDTIFRVDDQGVFKDYIPSKSFAAVLPSSNFIGQSYLQVLPPEMAQQLGENFRRVIETGESHLQEYVLRAGERVLYFEVRLVKMAQGDVLGIVRDVTDRKQAEAAIRESEALFRNLADSAPALITMLDESGSAVYLNRTWQGFRGNVPPLSLDRWAEYVHPDDRRRYMHEFRSALRDHRKFTTEYRLRRADGQYRWILDTIVPRYAGGERFAGFIGIAIDITDRKNAEEALRRSESRLRLLTDNMVDTISQIDAQQRLIYSSPSAERVFGYALRDLLGNSWYDFVQLEDATRLHHQLLLAIELHVPSLRLEYRYRHAAGHYLWVESEMRLLYDERGDFTGAVFGSRDISSRKQIEAEREKLIRELEEKNAELEHFTYTVSHDLKSPLITIRGFLGFLEKDATTGNLDRLRADIARIIEATTRMQRLLDELLDLSRIGRMINPPEEVAFDQIAREAVELAQGRVTSRGVRVEIADHLAVVYGDRTRLVEAVQNLVDNAAKFMGDQPEPRIVIGALGVERDSMPIFFVQDNGMGIEAEYHERIFGLFNKLDAQSEGTGVGLALVKRIIDIHGGHIWVESGGNGRGSTFFFTLPRPAPASGNA